jgi:hypothetical protein
MLPPVNERRRTEGLVLVPALLAVGLLVLWAADGGGYAATTWLPSALGVLGLLAASIAGFRLTGVRPARPVALALGLFAAYTAWSYLSIAWASVPGDALDGANRTLLYLLLFALFALLPWRAWTAFAALAAFAIGVGALALAALFQMAADGGGELFHAARLAFPLDYENGSPALFTMGALCAIALASRRELPLPLRPLLVVLATAALQVAVLSASRGWLFSLPIVAVATLALVPGRVRLALWSLPVAAGTLVALPALLDVFARAEAADNGPETIRVRADAAMHAADVALPILLVVLLAALALALLDQRVTPSAATVARTNRVAAVLAAAAAVLAVAAVFVATDGRPDRKVTDYFSDGYDYDYDSSSRFALGGSNRSDFWRVSLDAFADHPFVGLGQDNWGDYYLAHRDSDEQPRWTHSLELRLLAHTGIVGFLLFAAFAVAALVAAMRPPPDTPRLAVAAARIALLPFVVWVVHGSIDWFWEFPALAGPALGFLGLAAGLARPAADAAPRTAPQPGGTADALRAGGAAALAVGVLLLAAVALALPYLAEREIARAADGWREDPANALQRLARASDFNPLSARPDLTAGVIAIDLRQPALAHERLDAALEREPDNWFALLLRALAEADEGDRAAARADLRRARELNPLEPLLREALGRFDSDRPMTTREVLATLREAAVDPNDPDATG